MERAVWLSGATFVRSISHNVRSPVERGDIRIATVNKCFFTGPQTGYDLLLPLQLSRQRLIYCPNTCGIGIIDKAIVAMAIVIPARMIRDWIKADAFNRDTSADRGENFVAHISQPRRTCFILNPGLGDKARLPVMGINLTQEIANMPVTRIGELRQHVRIIECLQLVALQVR